MGYTPYMKELIQKVEATRDKRVDQDFPRMTPEEKEEVLQNYHPDYIEDQFREIKVGPNRGDRAPHEVADILEAYPRLNPDNIDLAQIDYDVDALIIGGGGAGASAALLAHQNGADVLLATKLRLGDANTMMAQGGIQAADKEVDSPGIHYLDVMGGGHFHNTPELVRTLVRDAPFVVKWLEDLGAMFDKDKEGNMLTRHGGGTSRKRMHSARDYTGAEIMRTIRDELLNQSGVNIIEFSPVTELLLDDQGRAAGAVLYNLETQDFLVVKAKTVIIATGGLGRLHTQGFPTTNHYGATGDGLVLAYRAGAQLAFMDTIQYHPTGAAYPEQIEGLLITEKVRSLGATPVNIDGEMFVYHLETRDVESSAFIRECVERNKGITTPSGMQGVWLDSPLIDKINGEGTIEKQVPAMVRMFERFGIDITKEPILVYPTLHYQNGGVYVDENCMSSVENLYVAGEASGGVHGRNRLMGNSLLDVVVFGRRAGKYAAEKAKEIDNTEVKLNFDHVHDFVQELKEQEVDTDRRSPMLLPDYTGKTDQRLNCEVIM